MQMVARMAIQKHRVWWRWVSSLILIFVLRVVMLYASRLIEYSADVSLWFPATAVTFAAFAVFRWWALLPLILANLLGSVVSTSDSGLERDWLPIVIDGLSYSAVHCAAYGLLAECVRRSVRARHEVSLGKTVGVFLVGGLVASAFAAIGGVAVGCTAGTMTNCLSASYEIIPWLVGDYVGLISLAPLVLYGFMRLAERQEIPFPGELAAFDDVPKLQKGDEASRWRLAWVIGSVAVILCALSAFPRYQPAICLIFLLVIVQLWMVHTQTIRQTLAGIAMFGLALVFLTAQLELDQYALLLQSAMITLAGGSYLCIAVPVLYAQNDRLRAMIVRDSMTGAFTRYFFVEISEQAIRRAAMSRKPTSMLMLDLDWLKQINDHHGHQAGDFALSHVAELVSQSLSSSDFFGRLGGDEFGILLPDSDTSDALRLAARVHDKVKQSRYPFESRFSPSVSIGVATISAPEETYDCLWMRADSALYVAKREGRGRYAQFVGM